MKKIKAEKSYVFSSKVNQDKNQYVKAKEITNVQIHQNSEATNEEKLQINTNKTYRERDGK